jgi:pyruvate dehydrogenase complex dehydrogenase (E1) component
MTDEELDKEFSEEEEEEYIKILNEVRNGEYHTFRLDDNFYGFNFFTQQYYEYGLDEIIIEISRKDLIKKIDVYLREYKLRKIISRI